MKEVFSFLIGFVIGAVVMYIFLGQGGLGFLKEHELKQKTLSDSLKVLNKQIHDLKTVIAVTDGIIDQNKAEIGVLRDSLRNKIKTLEFNVPTDSIARKEYLDSIITECSHQLDFN